MRILGWISALVYVIVSIIICIAVSLEAVVYISMARKDQVQNLIYPAILLLSAVAVMVGSGTYQK